MEEGKKCSFLHLTHILTWQVKEPVAFLLSITTSSSSWVHLSSFYCLCNKYSTPTVSGRERRGGDWKEQNNAFFHQKFLLFPYLKVSSSEPLERWATMWPHSEHLVTIWNTPAVNWRRWRRERRSLVLFMILGLVAIWVPPSCLLRGMAPICEGV